MTDLEQEALSIIKKLGDFANGEPGVRDLSLQELRQLEARLENLLPDLPDETFQR